MPDRTHTGRGIARLVVVAIAVLLVAACSGGGAGIRASDAWARRSPMVAGAGAAYVVIENTGSSADALVGAASDVAKSTEIHETYEVQGSPLPAASTGMGGMASPAASDGTDTGSPMMGMRRVDRVEVPAGGRLELKPGGYHIMLIELTRELKVGDKVVIMLRFEKAGEVKVTAEVREG